jgi:hypothetical protein
MAFMQKAKVGVPDSRYAEELGKGTNDMTFSPELEGEYRRFFLSERRSQVRAFQALLTALAVWALLASFASTPHHDHLVGLQPPLPGELPVHCALCHAGRRGVWSL